MRPFSTIWKYWKEVETPGKLRIVECNYCSNKQGRNATKCELHTSKCKGPVPEEYRALIRQALKNKRKRSYVKSSRLENTVASNLIPVNCTNVPAISLRVPSFSSPTVIQNDQKEQNQSTTVINKGNYYFEDEIEVTGRTILPSDDKYSSTKQTCTGHAKISSGTNLISIVSKKKYKELTNLFGKAIFTSRVPFEFVENPFLKEFFKELSSGFVLPSQRVLSENLLSSVYEETQKETLNMIEKSKFITVIVAHQPNVAKVILCIPEPIFYRAVETNGGQLAASEFSDLICEVAKSVGLSKVCAFVSGQLLDLQSVQAMVRESLPHVLGVRSAVHVLTEFVNNVSRLPTVNRFLNDIKAIFGEFHRSKSIMQLFYSTWNDFVKEEMKHGRKVSRSTLYIYSESKWPVVHEMLEKLLNSKPVLQRIALCIESDQGHWRLLNEDIFWHQLQETYLLFKVVSEGILRMESDSATISDATEVFKGILNKFLHFLEDGDARPSNNITCLTVSEAKAIGAFVRYLTEENPLSDAHIAAYMLDPRFESSLLTAAELTSGLHFMWNYAKSLGYATNAQKEELSDSWQEFDTRTGIFDCEILFGSKKINPAKWWQSSILVKNHHILSTIASRLLSIPASSTAVEKNFKSNGESEAREKRNGLSDSQLQKLNSIETSFRLTNREFQESRLNAGKEAINVEDILVLGDPFPINSDGEVQIDETSVYCLTEVELDYHEHDYSVQ